MIYYHLGDLRGRVHGCWKERGERKKRNGTENSERWLFFANLKWAVRHSCLFCGLTPRFFMVCSKYGTLCTLAAFPFTHFYFLSLYLENAKKDTLVKRGSGNYNSPLHSANFTHDLFMRFLVVVPFAGEFSPGT